MQRVPQHEHASGRLHVPLQRLPHILLRRLQATSREHVGQESRARSQDELGALHPVRQVRRVKEEEEEEYYEKEDRVRSFLKDVVFILHRFHFGETTPTSHARPIQSDSHSPCFLATARRIYTTIPSKECYVRIGLLRIRDHS